MPALRTSFKKINSNNNNNNNNNIDDGDDDVGGDANRKRHGEQLLDMTSLEKAVGGLQWRESTFLNNHRTRISPASPSSSGSHGGRGGGAGGAGEMPKPLVARVVVSERFVGVQADVWDSDQKVRWFADGVASGGGGGGGGAVGGDPYARAMGRKYEGHEVRDLLLSAVQDEEVQRAGLLTVDMKFIDQWFDPGYGGHWGCFQCIKEALSFCEIPEDVAKNNREWTYVLMNTGTVCGGPESKAAKEGGNCVEKCSAAL